jgi:alpha-L-fucosidase
VKILLSVPSCTSGLIQSVSQSVLPGLGAWVEVGEIAPSQCPKAFLPQPISI